MAEAPAAPPRRTLAGQLLSYAFVGVLSNVGGYLVYLLITHLGAEPKITMTALYLTGASLGFWGNRRITFRHEEKGMAVGFRYILVHGAGYLINLAILYALVDRLGYPHQLAQALGIVVVAGFLFSAFKHFVFAHAASTRKDSP